MLFIGNSLTYRNDLPATVAAIENLSGDTIRVAVSAGADVGLIDHAKSQADAIGRLSNDKWNFVILQQGPATAGACRDTLVLASRLLQGYMHGAHESTLTFVGMTC